MYHECEFDVKPRITRRNSKKREKASYEQQSFFQCPREKKVISEQGEVGMKTK